MNTKYLFLVFALSISFTYAQESNWIVQISQSPGKLIKHSKKFKFEPYGFSEFSEIDFIYQTRGIRDWELFYHLPRVGLSLRYLYLGQPTDIIGDGYSIYPFIDFGFFRRSNSSLRFTIGCGIAYLNKSYHINYNPNQTAIGSHLNDLTTFQFKYEHSINKINAISAGISLTHISNGAFQAPNLGLNFVSAIIGYSFHFNKSHIDTPLIKPWLNSSSSEFQIKPVGLLNKFSCDLEYGLTLIEDQVPGGPKFLIQWYSLDAGYQYSRYQSVRVSLDIEHNNFDIYKEKSTKGRKLNLYIGHQWLFGDVGLNFRNGYEFIRDIESKTFPIATKLDLFYILPFKLTLDSKLYIGFSLKAHLTTAEYIGVMTGLRLFNK